MHLLYLDPGSGSILLQLLIAALAGVGIFVGSQWAKIKRLLGKKKEKVADEEERDEE